MISVVIESNRKSHTQLHRKTNLSLTGIIGIKEIVFKRYSLNIYRSLLQLTERRVEDNKPRTRARSRPFPFMMYNNIVLPGDARAFPSKGLYSTSVLNINRHLPYIDLSVIGVRSEDVHSRKIVL